VLSGLWDDLSRLWKLIEDMGTLLSVNELSEDLVRFQYLGSLQNLCNIDGGDFRNA